MIRVGTEVVGLQERKARDGTRTSVLGKETSMATKNPTQQEIWDVQRNELMATASENTIKRARWEHLRFAPCTGAGKINVCNVSYGVQAKGEHTYTVTVEKGQPTDCTCPAAEYQSGPCKHSVAVASEPEVIREAEGQ